MDELSREKEREKEQKLYDEIYAKLEGIIDEYKEKYEEEFLIEFDTYGFEPALKVHSLDLYYAYGHGKRPEKRKKNG